MSKSNTAVQLADEQGPLWRQERRARIVAAATDLFGRLPFNAVQMDDIARVSGAAKPTLYRYFPTKEALFLAATDNILAVLEQDLDAALAEQRPAADTITAMLRILVERFATQLASVNLLGGDQAGLADRTRALFRDRRSRLIDLIRRALVRGRDAGILRDMDIEATAPMLLGVIRGGMLGAAHLPPDRMIAAATALVLSGTLKQA